MVKSINRYFLVVLAIVFMLSVVTTSAFAAPPETVSSTVAKEAVQKTKVIGEHTIAYKVRGETAKKADKTFVLIHGAVTNAWATEPLAEEIAKQLPEYQVVQIDLPGHGLSTGPVVSNIKDIAKILEDFFAWARDSKEFSSDLVAAGVSMGGSVVQQLAIDKTKGLDEIVLLNTAPNWENFVPFKDLTADFYDANYKSLTRDDFKICTTSEQQAAFELYLEKMYPGGATAVADVQALIAFNSLKDLSKIKNDTLVFASEDDGTASLAQSELIASKIKKAELMTIPMGGHTVILKHPAWVAKQIVKFLND